MRHLRGFLLSNESLAMINKGGRVRIYQPVSLPETATLVSAHHDHMRQALVLIFEDESFEPGGPMIPIDETEIRFVVENEE